MPFHSKRALYNIREAPLGTLLNVLLCAAVLVFLLSIQLVVRNAVSYIDHRLQNTPIVIYLADSGTHAELERLAQEFQVRWTFLDAEDARELFASQYPREAQLLEDLDRNPLPASYLMYITADSLGDYRALVQRAGNLDRIAAIEFPLEDMAFLTRLERWLQGSRWILWLLGLGFAATIIAAGVRASYYRYGEELAVLRSLGATGLFLRMAYYLEALLMSLMAIALGVPLYRWMESGLAGLGGERGFPGGYALQELGWAHLVLVVLTLLLVIFGSSVLALRERPR